MRAAIFDLDGTLIDSMGEWNVTSAAFLAEHGIAAPPDLLEKIRTMPFEVTGRYFTETLGIPGKPESVMAALYGIMLQKYETTVPLKEGAKAYLEKLYAEGQKLAIVTANRTKLTEVILKRLEIYDLFSVILTAEMTGSGGEKSGDFLQAAEALGETHEDIEVYEDSLLPTRAAKEAGFFVTGVYDESAAKDKEQMLAVCDRFIYSFLELL